MVVDLEQTLIPALAARDIPLAFEGVDAPLEDARTLAQHLPEFAHEELGFRLGDERRQDLQLVAGEHVRVLSTHKMLCRAHRQINHHFRRIESGPTGDDQREVGWLRSGRTARGVESVVRLRGWRSFRAPGRLRGGPNVAPCRILS